MQFLMGLDDSYMQIRSTILSREDLPDVRSAYATISSEESHRVAVGSIVGSSQRNRASAFVSNVPYDQNFQRNNQNNSNGPSRPNNLNNNKQGEGSGLVCENCRFNGHTIDRCFKIIEYPADFGKRKPGQNFKKQNVGKNMQVNMAVGHPNGTEVYISKIGNLRLSNSLTLYVVMVIPEYCVTLIFVHKLAKENKIIVAIDENRCYFLNQDLNLKNVLEPVLNVLKDSLPIDKRIIMFIVKLFKELRNYRTFSIKLLSSVLNEKSPYEMIYKKCPTLSHLRMFGCLCFATIVNNNDKFSSRSEKCVMIGYYNFKKGYRLYSLDKHQFIFSRDVKFFENIFPFKDSEVEKNDSTNVFQDVNHINFIDIEYPGIPNDDERVANKLNKDKSDSSNSSVSGSNINTADFPVENSGNDADSTDELVTTQNEKVVTLKENVFSEGNLNPNLNSSHDVQNVRRSSRQSVFPRNYNDFVVESKVKYGLEKYVGYSKHNTENLCFVTQLN
ncbi:ribonuclease H-like domain-containing protein [Tanacetum coccineum]|uniref:Ribonuclease H-like domain-containing protein n=1 Tax=Tanacetum coccineum TaxID=301880 RepID=A0ABQ4XDT5_9ASTR